MLLILTATLASADLPQITIEAEDYTQASEGEVRVLDRAEASGGRCVSYWEEHGVALTCDFEVVEAGDYCLTIGYALNWPDTRREVRVDGEIVPGLENVRLPTTGSWEDFSAMTLVGSDGGRARIRLDAGTHTLTLTNVDSRGLAWDFAILHDPAMLIADAPLSAEELAKFARTLPSASRSLLEQRQTGERGGRTTVALTERGQFYGWLVGDILAATSVRGPAGPRDPAHTKCIQEELGDLRILHHGNAPDTVSCGGAGVYILSDRALYVIGAAREAVDGEKEIPVPVIEWRDGVAWQMAPRTIFGQMNETATGMIGDIQLSSITPMRVAVLDDGGPRLQTAWLLTGEISAYAYRVGSSFAPADMRIDAGIEGADIVIRSAADMPSALAQFYGVTRFEVRVHPDASMTITSDAGERLELPAP